MRLRLLLLAAASASSGVHATHVRHTELKTEYIVQQTPSWCWAATASMALELLRFPDINPAKNYQCGVVAAAFPECDDDCTKCDNTIETMRSFVGLLNRYRDRALKGKQAKLKASFSPTYVPHPTYAQVRHSLDLSTPVIAGISPDGPPSDPAKAEHSVLITGYDDDYLGTGDAWVIVRDPYPYGDVPNPWISAGYPYTARTGTALVPWRALRDRMYFSSAVFLRRQNG